MGLRDYLSQEQGGQRIGVERVESLRSLLEPIRELALRRRSLLEPICELALRRRSIGANS